MKNPFAQMPQPLQLVITGAPPMLDAIEAAVEDEVYTITRDLSSVEARNKQLTRSDDKIPSRLTLLIDRDQKPLLTGLITAAAQPFGGAEIVETKLAEIDWVSKVQKDFPPFVMGPFYVHGSHAPKEKPKNRFPLLVDAAAAFGTGEHATTAGCLLALALEKRTRRYADRILDMGSGTGILAVGAARLWKAARIVACDYDPVAVKVSRHNLRVNQMRHRSETFVSNGYNARQVRGIYPVIVANILAKPLMKMARGASRHMAPGGTLILSGLMHDQERMVLSAHRMQQRYLKKRLRRGQWSVLVLR